MATFQKVYEKGERKALVTRLAKNCWSVARGWRGQIKVERYKGDETITWTRRWQAENCATRWINESVAGQSPE